MLQHQVSHPQIGLTTSEGGSGFLPLQRLDSVHAAFLRTVRFRSGTSRSFSRCGIMAEPRITSRHSGLSPAMFPSAQTACVGCKGRGEREDN